MLHRPLFSAALFTLCLTGMATVAGQFTATPAYAAKEQSQKVGAKVAKPLLAAQELAKDGKFKEALEKVKEAQAVEKKSPYEEHTINEFVGYVAANLKDYGSAAKAFEATTNSGFLPADQLPTRLKTVIQLYYQVNNYDKTLALANRYLKEVGPDTDISVLVGQVHYLKQDFAKCSAVMNGLIADAERKGGSVKESWLQLAMSSAFKQQDMPAVLQTLKKLLRHHPSTQYWEEALDIATRQPGLSDKANLDYYRLRYKNGLITRSDEMVEMAQLAIQAGLPGEAQAILEKGFADKILGVTDKERENRLLTMAKQQAADDVKSLGQLEKEASAAKTGDALIKLGEAYTSYGQYDKALAAITRGLEKGGLADADDAKLRLALAHIYSGNTAPARNILKEIKTDTNTGKIAEFWSLYSLKN